ncbi:hypothetical protein Hanom_Chr09g00783551 [Helianthus anomalus]
MWWIIPKISPVKCYSQQGHFKLLTKVYISMLVNAPYTDDKPNGRGYLFFKRLERKV